MLPVVEGEAPAPPGPRGRRLLGSLLAVRRDKIRFVERAFREHGDVVGFSMGPGRRLILIHHPEGVRHVLREREPGFVKGIGYREAEPLLGAGLLTAEGAAWRGQRDRMRVAFRRSAMTSYAAVMGGAAVDLAERWRGAAEAGETVDLAAEATRYTLEVLGRTLFGCDLAGRAGAITHDLDRVVRWAMRRMTGVVRPPLGLPTPANLACRRSLARLARLADELVAEARAGGGSALPWSDGPERRDEVLTLLLAGHETTAVSLAWTCHLLAWHPEAREEVEAEARAVLAGRAPGFDDLPHLPAARAAVEEAIRLYPPVWMITRRALADDEVMGYRVPRGADLLVSVYTLHRHPAFWSDPEAFRPQRFRGGPPRPAGSYIPFGHGPRACLGSAFGLMEATLAVAALAGRWRLEPAPGPAHGAWSPGGREASPRTGSVPPVALDALLTLHPRGPLPVRPRPLG
ncbi:MAG TPA: cytochrome P450 [Thermoanaerobaculia bacterium]|nr:cytochrome P450 [Thermoanaerobaculia bacterium]